MAIVWLALVVAMLDTVLVKTFKLDPMLVILYRAAGRLLKSIIDVIRGTQLKRASASAIRPQDAEA